MKLHLAIIVALLALIVPSSAFSQGEPAPAESAPAAQSTIIGIGLRAGAGTDIRGGIAFGGGINYALPFENIGIGFGGSLEVSLLIFGNNFSESTEEGIHTYDEDTNLIVGGITGTFIWDYSYDRTGFFFLTGFGFAIVSYDWEERSATDTSLGTPWGAGSMQSASGTGAGTVIDLGAGYNFGSGFDLRFEIPMIFTFSAPGQATKIAITFILTLGYRF